MGLWELEALGKHWFPLVSRLVEHFRNPDMFLKSAPPCDVNQFLEMCNPELLRGELKRKRRRFDDERADASVDGLLAFTPRIDMPSVEGIYKALAVEQRKRRKKNNS